MDYPRTITNRVDRLRRQFPVISIVGPRQSGKTTFIKNHFPDFHYVNLEHPPTRDLIKQDVVGFLNQHPDRLIIDEVQRLPDLLSYIQVHVDERKQMGSIIISGSQNLLISEQISQSLAGRVAQIELFPLSLEEMHNSQLTHPSYHHYIWHGFYPAIYDRSILPPDYYSQYIATYVERDVRLMKQINNLSQFRKCLGLLAGRVGQILNLSSIANEVGISHSTVERWVSILEASYLCFRLPPYYRNHGKRLVKSPKLYFYDTGLLCHLLNIHTPQTLQTHHAVGSIFENFIITELLKHQTHASIPTSLYFLRDNHGHEIDLLIERENTLIPIEIKSSATFHSHFTKGLKYWQKQDHISDRGYVIYGGDQAHPLQENQLIGWQSITSI